MFPGTRRATQQPAHLVPTPPYPAWDLCPDPQQAPGSHLLPAFPQPPFSSAEHTMFSKCFLGAGKECTVPFPTPGG